MNRLLTTVHPSLMRGAYSHSCRPTQLRGGKRGVKKTPSRICLPLLQRPVLRGHWLPHALRCCMALVFAALFCLPTLAAEEKDLSVNTRDQIQILQEEKLARTPIHKKLDSQLVYALRERRLGLAVRGSFSLKPALTVEPDGRLLVDIRGRVSPGLLGLIKQNGGIVISS